MSIAKRLNIKKDVILAKYTTFHIGGPARFFVEVNSSDELVEAVNWAKEKNLKYFILGGGSNVLFKDEGYDGLVVQIQNSKFKIQNSSIVAGAGMMLGKLLKLILDNNLTGLEWAAGIPGTVGGAICGNAGTLNGCMSDIVELVEVFDGEKVLELKKEDLKFGYRTSIFTTRNNAEQRGTLHNSLHRYNKLIILSAKLRLKKGDQEQSKKLVKKYLAERKDKQPPGFSAGSIFKNLLPSPHTPTQARDGRAPLLFKEGLGVVAAGKLIEQCGLKGLKIGDAQISKRHANFVINLGDASAKDVLALIEKIKNEVNDKFRIKLKEEIQIV